MKKHNTMDRWGLHILGLIVVDDKETGTWCSLHETCCRPADWSDGEIDGESFSEWTGSSHLKCKMCLLLSSVIGLTIVKNLKTIEGEGTHSSHCTIYSPFLFFPSLWHHCNQAVRRKQRALSMLNTPASGSIFSSSSLTPGYSITIIPFIT